MSTRPPPPLPPSPNSHRWPSEALSNTNSICTTTRSFSLYSYAPIVHVCPEVICVQVRAFAKLWNAYYAETYLCQPFDCDAGSPSGSVILSISSKVDANSAGDVPSRSECQQGGPGKKRQRRWAAIFHVIVRNSGTELQTHVPERKFELVLDIYSRISPGYTDPLGSQSLCGVRR